MRVLVAPDKFKGSLTAVQVAGHVAAGLQAAAPDLGVDQLPVADGGDGTVEAAMAAGYRRVPVRALGPTGEMVETSYAERDDGVAVVELADVSGLRRLPDGTLSPLTASSYGTGQVVRAALDAGARRIVLGVGGSASTDGGAGLVEALGARLLDEAREPVPRGGAGLIRLHQLDLTGLHPALRGSVEVVVACDVDNPLFGPHGAAAVYGPQKGASPEDVAALETALRHWARVVAEATGRDYADVAGAGAAGGVAFGALAILGATVRTGIDLVLDLIGFADRLNGAALVVTGEGSLDAQTLRGKAPAGVAAAAGAAGIPVVAVAGRCLLEPAELHAAGIRRAYSLVDLEPDLARSMTEAGPLLEQLAARIAADWLPTPTTTHSGQERP
jgi:glycerate 2-kinase